MAVTTVNSQNIATDFHKKLAHEYIRKGKFAPYMGKSPNSIIQVVEGLKKCSIPFVAALGSGGGVKGSATLSGNEVALDNYAYELTPTYERNAVTIDNEENEKSEFQLKEEARPALMNWAHETKRDQIIEALNGVEAGGTYRKYGDASATELDTWNTNNADRILYGNSEANRVAGDHTASLATIDATNDKISSATLDLMKDMAEDCKPLIRPHMIDGDDPYYVLFVNTACFNALRADSSIEKSNHEARARGLNNPVFTGSDMIYNGIIIKKIPDMNIFTDATASGDFQGSWGGGATADGLDNAGAAGIKVHAAFLCGAQAIGFGLGKSPTFKVSKEDDYEFKNGVANEFKQDVKKVFYNNKQHGIITGFFAA